MEGLLAGLYRYAAAPGDSARSAQILASGVALRAALEAQQLLADDWGVQADVWSATSWTELRRDAVEVDRHNLLHPEAEPRVPYVTAAAAATRPVRWSRCRTGCARSRTWSGRGCPATVTLGTDGFGFSDTRPAARRHFLVDAESITVAVGRWWHGENSPWSSRPRGVSARRRVRGRSADLGPGGGLAAS